MTLPDGTIITEDSAAISAADLTALQGTPTSADSGTPTTLVYPYDQTVFPLGLLAPVPSSRAGSVAPVDFKMSLDTTGFHWDGFGHVGNPAALQAAIPQAAWDGALATATATPTAAVVTLSLVKAAAGVAYGPAQSHLTSRTAKLTGVIYYESYSTDRSTAAPTRGPTDFGLWAVKPGSQPPSHLQPGCVICHGVAAVGEHAHERHRRPHGRRHTGVFRVEADGGYTHLATAPTALPYAIAGGDRLARHGWGTVSPDGKVDPARGHHFWGGRRCSRGPCPASPSRCAGVRPAALDDDDRERRLQHVRPGVLSRREAPGLRHRDEHGRRRRGGHREPVHRHGRHHDRLGDGGGDAGFGAVTLANARTLYDSTAVDGGGAGTSTKVPTFLPDSQSIVFEETRDATPGTTTCSRTSSRRSRTPSMASSRCCSRRSGGGVCARRARERERRYDPASPMVNYEPKPLPVQVGGYYWVVFASLRQDAYPSLAAPKKLWVTAISPGATPGVDPSHPPLTLVNQAIVAPQASQRAYWALAPCLGIGASCQTGNDCCNGSCLPSSSTDASSPLECLAPTTTACAALGARCAAGQDQDCCGVASGVKCIGTLNGYGTCNAPGPPP